MQSLQINSINNFSFGNRYRGIRLEKPLKTNNVISKEEIFSIKNRLEGVYRYTKEGLANLYAKGLIDEKTYIRRLEETQKRYIKELQRNGLSI